MKIKRKVGRQEMEFELTDHELFDAYYEQQFIFDYEAVRGFFESFSDDKLKDYYGMPFAKLEPYFEAVATEMRRQMDKYDVDYEYALTEAISSELPERGEEETDA